MKNLDRKKVLREEIIIQHHNVQKEQEELINLKKKLIADLVSDDFKSSSNIKTPLGIVRIARKNKTFVDLFEIIKRNIANNKNGKENTNIIIEIMTSNILFINFI